MLRSQSDNLALRRIEDEMTGTDKDHADVVIFPPLLLALMFGLGIFVGMAIANRIPRACL